MLKCLDCFSTQSIYITLFGTAAVAQMINWCFARDLYIMNAATENMNTCHAMYCENNYKFLILGVQYFIWGPCFNCVICVYLITIGLNCIWSVHSFQTRFLYTYYIWWRIVFNQSYYITVFYLNQIPKCVFHIFIFPIVDFDWTRHRINQLSNLTLFFLPPIVKLSKSILCLTMH